MIELKCESVSYKFLRKSIFLSLVPQKKEVEKEESSWEDTKLLLRPVKRKPSKFIMTYELSEDGDEAPPTADDTGFSRKSKILLPK